MPPGCRVAAVAGTADKRWIACFMGNPFVSVAFLVVGWSFSMTCRKMFGVHHSQWIWCRDSVSDERLFGCGYARIVFTQDGWSPHDSFDHWSCLLLEKSEWTSPFFMVVVINSKHPSSQEANHTMISYIFQMGYVIVFRCIQCGQLPPTEGEMLLQVLSGYPKLVNHVWITLWEFFFFFLVFLLHVYTLTSIYHLNHLSFESSSDLGAPIGLQETDHLTIRILSSFSSEAGEVKWGTPGGFFPQKPQGICDLDYGICTKAPPRRGSNLHQWRWPPCMDWIFWHFWWLSIAHVTCPGPCYRRCCVFFFAKSQIVVLVEGFGGEIDRESRKLRVKPGNLALVLSTWCCFSSLSPFGRIIMVMPGWGFDNFIRQERLWRAQPLQWTHVSPTWFLIIAVPLMLLLWDDWWVEYSKGVAGQMSFRVFGVKLLFQVALLEVRIHAAYIV